MTECSCAMTEMSMMMCEIHGVDAPAPCASCGAEFPENAASVTYQGQTYYYCHPDEGYSCYSGDVV